MSSVTRRRVPVRRTSIRHTPAGRSRWLTAESNRMAWAPVTTQDGRRLDARWSVRRPADARSDGHTGTCSRRGSIRHRSLPRRRAVDGSASIPRNGIVLPVSSRSVVGTTARNVAAADDGRRHFTGPDATATPKIQQDYENILKIEVLLFKYTDTTSPRIRTRNRREATFDTVLRRFVG